MAATVGVARAVDLLFEAATDEESRSLEGLLRAAARHTGRPLSVADDTAGRLGRHVFGQWHRFADRDEILVATWACARARVVAHELGHIMLGHPGVPAQEADQWLAPSAAAIMMGAWEPGGGEAGHTVRRRQCGEAATSDDVEVEAEFFASLLLRRLAVGSAARTPRLHARLDEAFG